MKSKIFVAILIGIVLISNLMPRLLSARLSAILILFLCVVGMLGIYDRVFDYVFVS
jgi:hypothetical protein